MRCFTDAQLKLGITAVLEGHDRCALCGQTRGARDRPPHEAAHPFVAPDPFDLFLSSARETEPDDVAPGERDHE